MRLVAPVALVVLAACGGQPALANVPHPSNAAVAGGAAAAAAAITLAAPDATKKPEKNKTENLNAVEVNQSVPADVLDRLDHPEAQKPSDQESARPKKPKGPIPKLPTPREAVEK
jgi:hypothetical protein